MIIPEKFDKLTGVIQSASGNLLFVSDEYKFIYLFDNLNAKALKRITLKPDGGFIFGQTHSRYDIATYLGNQHLDVFGSQVLNTGGFVVSSGNCSKQNMQYWDLSLADKIEILYSKHSTELCKLPSLNCCVDKRLISEFVKYRNDVTHGRHRIINQDIANTTYVMGALAYCAFLERMGLDSKTISDLCQSKIMT